MGKILKRFHSESVPELPFISLKRCKNLKSILVGTKLSNEGMERNNSCCSLCLSMVVKCVNLCV